MVRLDYLDYFTIYKAKDRVMMPETKNTPKKGQAYIVDRKSVG